VICLSGVSYHIFRPGLVLALNAYGGPALIRMLTTLEIAYQSRADLFAICARTRHIFGMTETTDIIVIGAGVAGLGVAAHLAGQAKVVVLEAERAPCMHTSGRSAAMFLKTYGPPGVRALTAQSEAFFEAPPDGFCDGPLLTPRGVLHLDDGDGSALRQLQAGGGVEEISAEDAQAMIPILKREGLTAVGWEAKARDIDIDLLTGGYRRMIRAAGGKIVCNARAMGMQRTSNWRVETTAGVFEAPILVNAAGAWATPVAVMAGLTEMAGAAITEITPKRRSAAMVMSIGGHDPRKWPMFLDAEERFYARPMSGGLMVSPADEIPVPPQDIQVDKYDDVLVEGLWRYEQRVIIPVTRVENPWAGLRSFSPDGEPVVGFDAGADGFFWLAGQGGYGFQTAPALSAEAAKLILGQRANPAMAALSPKRF
jgi:D-arginine dehydrogenase